MKTLYKVLLLVLIVLIAGSGFYYWQKQEEKHKSPPSLTFGSDTTFLKAYLASTNYAEYTDADVSAWTTSGYQKTADVDTNVHYYYPSNDISVDNILKSIKPIVGNKVIFLFYSPGGENLGAGTTSEGYYTYPDISAAATGGTTPVRGVSESQKTSFKVPKNRAFALVLNGSVTEFWNKAGADIYDETATVEDYGSEGIESLLDGLPNGGWVMIPLKEISPADIGTTQISYQNSVNDEDFMVLSYLFESHDLISVFYLNGENQFGQVTNQEDLKELIDGSAGYAILWLRLDSSITFPQFGNPACSDLVDNDHDTKTDYSADPGCTNALDTDETDAPAVTWSVAPNPATGGTLNAGDGYPNGYSSHIRITFVGSTVTYTPVTSGVGLTASVAGMPSALGTPSFSNNVLDIPYDPSKLVGGSSYVLIVKKETLTSGGQQFLTGNIVYTYTTGGDSTQTVSYTLTPANGGQLVVAGGIIRLHFTSGVTALTLPGCATISDPIFNTINDPTLKKLSPSGSAAENKILSACASDEQTIKFIYGKLDGDSSYTLTIPKAWINGKASKIAVSTSITAQYTTLAEEIPPATWQLTCPNNKNLIGSGILGGSKEGKMLLYFSKEVQSITTSGIDLRQVTGGIFNKFKRVEPGVSAHFKYFFYELDTESGEEYSFTIPKNNITFTDGTKLTDDVVITGLKSVEMDTDQCASAGGSS